MSVMQKEDVDKLKDESLVYDTAKVTSGNKSTIPKALRQILEVERGDHVVWAYDPEVGKVVVMKE